MKNSISDERQLIVAPVGVLQKEYTIPTPAQGVLAYPAQLPLIEGANIRAQVYQDVAMRLRLQRMNDLLQAVFEIGNTLNSTQDAEQILSMMLEKITQLLDADRSTLFLVDHQTGEVWSRVQQGNHQVEIRLPLGEGIVGWVAQTGETVNIKDAYREPRFNRDVDKKSGYHTHTMLTTPLRNPQGDIIGVIQVLNKRDQIPFTEEDEHVLQTIASQAAIFLENARLYQALWSQHVALTQTTRQLKQREQELDVVYDIEQQISHSRDLDETLSNILRRVVVLLGCEAATLALIANGRSRIFLYSADPHDHNRVVIVPTQLKAGEGFVGHVLESGEALLVNRMDEETRQKRDFSAQLNIPVRSVLCVPIRNDEKLQGVIELLNKHSPNGFEDEDLRLMNLIATQIHRAIEIGVRQAAQERENRLATIGQLLSGVLHDFKSPMTIISGYAQMLGQQVDPAKRKSYAHTILKQIEQLNQMTREVLAFARGDSTLLVRKVSWVQFLQEVEQHLLQEFDDDAIHLHVENTYKGSIYLDEVKIQRMIFNLARNAGQAMKNGGTFELLAEQDGDQLSLTFRDTGPGIPPEIQAHIFESFVTSKSSEGTGLGLAIVKKIVEDHHGNIEFSSIPQIGTTFMVKLPLNGPSDHAHHGTSTNP